MKKIVLLLMFLVSIISIAGSWSDNFGTLYDAQYYMEAKIREVESKGYTVTSYNYGGSRNSWYAYVNWE